MISRVFLEMMCVWIYGINSRHNRTFSVIIWHFTLIRIPVTLRQKVDWVRQDVYMFRILIFSLIDAWIETAQYNTPLIMLALLTCDFYQVPILRTSQKS